MAGKKTAEFMIVNRRTGKALEAAGVENGQGVCQAAPTGGDAQLWAQDGARLVHKLSGKVLDVVHGGVESGTWAHLWEKVEDAPSQQWELVKITATYKKLLNVQSGKVLDIVDMSEEDGAPAQLWDDVDGVGQQWKLVPAEEEASPKTVTKTVKKPAAPRKDVVKAAARKVEEAVKETAATVKETVAKPAARKVEEAVKETAATVKEAVKETAAKPAAKKVEEAVKETAATVKEAVKETAARPAAKAPRRKSPAKGKK